mgnify:CR=1 FL=1|tara:strand:+ start:428 stop:772 length:345 start_codon:yes stop_codon:yes gene_type:complete
MNWNDEKLKYLYFAFIALIILLLIHSESKAFGFKSLAIRQMWNACFQTSINVEPHVPHPVQAMLCDCVVDKGRNFYLTHENYNRSTDNKTIVWANFVNDCKYEIHQILKGDQRI